MSPALYPPPPVGISDNERPKDKLSACNFHIIDETPLPALLSPIR